MHQGEWDSAVTRAAAAGDRVLNMGASSYQFGDRHAWKSMNMYSTTAQRQTQEAKTIFRCLPPLPQSFQLPSRTPQAA